MDASVNLRKALVEVTYAQLHGWVGVDAPRAVAAVVLDAWRLRPGVDDETRAAVLDRFFADTDPKPGADYLPEPATAVV